MREYRDEKFDAIRVALFNLWVYEPEKWELAGQRAIYNADSIHLANKLRKDAPGSLLPDTTRGTKIIFSAPKLAEFIGVPIQDGLVGRFQRWRARRKG